MVENTYVLLLKCRLRGRRVLIDSFVVTEHIGWYLYRDIKDPKLVLKGFDQFSYCLESNYLTLESANIYSVLLPTIPYYGCLVHKY